MVSNPWESIEFREEEIDTEQGKQKVYRLILFKEYQWVNFFFHPIMDEFLLKIRLRIITINDILALGDVIKSLVNSN